MIQKVQIQRLRGVNEGALEGLTPLTVLVGPNGSGKSTVLDALLIAASPNAAEAVGRVVRRRANLDRGARWLFWRADPSNAVALRADASGRTNQCTLELRNERSEKGRVTIVCEVVRLHGSYSVDTSKHRVYLEPSNQYEFDKGETLKQFVPEARFVAACSPDQPPLTELYSRAVEQGRKNEIDSLLRELIPGLDDLRILVDDDQPVLHLVFADYSVPVAAGGDGVVALVRLSFELAARKNGLVLMEEPEVHQHPAGLRLTARAILTAIRRGVQVIITTHSLELVDAILAQALPTDLDRISVHRLKLSDGTLKASRLAGQDVAAVRGEIQDDLR